MEAYKHTDYMQTVAERLTDILHSPKKKAFAEATTLNLLEGLTESIGTLHYPCLVIIDDFTIRLTDNRSDNLIKTPYYQFAILMRANVNDVASQRKAREDAEAICDKVLSRMFRDQRARTNGLTYLQRDGIRFEGLGPLADGVCGCMVSFTLTKPAGIVYDSNDWTDG